MGKSLLLLEGGAYRGIFTAGVLDAFISNDIYFDVVAGISAGALCGYNYISRDFERNKRIIIEYGQNKKYFSKRNILKTGSAFGSNFVFNDLEKIIPFNKDNFINGSKFLVGAVNCYTGECEYFSKEDENFIDCIVASSAMPIVSKMVKINNVPYLDGGIAEHVPLSLIELDEYDDILCVLTKPYGFRKEDKESSLKSLYKLKYKKYPKLLEKLINENKYYNEERERLEHLIEEGKIKYIAPDERFKVTRIEKNIDNLKEGYELGLESGLKFIKENK